MKSILRTILVLAVMLAILLLGGCGLFDSKPEPTSILNTPGPVESQEPVPTPQPTVEPTPAPTPLPEHKTELREGFVWYEWDGKAIQYPADMEASAPIDGILYFKSLDGKVSIILSQIEDSGQQMDSEALAAQAKEKYGNAGFSVNNYSAYNGTYRMKFSLQSGDRKVVGEQLAKIGVVPGEVSFVTLVTDTETLTDQLSESLNWMFETLEEKPAA